MYIYIFINVSLYLLSPEGYIRIYITGIPHVVGVPTTKQICPKNDMYMYIYIYIHINHMYIVYTMFQFLCNI